MSSVRLDHGNARPLGDMRPFGDIKSFQAAQAPTRLLLLGLVGAWVPATDQSASIVRVAVVPTVAAIVPTVAAIVPTLVHRISGVGFGARPVLMMMTPGGSHGRRHAAG
jgi:hypothetical protein